MAIALMLAALPSPSSDAVGVGPLTIRAYGVAIAIGVVLGVRNAQRRWDARGGDAADIASLALWAVPAGLVGARLYHVVTDWHRVPARSPSGSPGIDSSSADGGVRRCSMGDAELVEEIVTVDDTLRRFQYRITEGPTPLEFHLGTVDVLADSMTLTADPSRAKAWASSQPLAPPPSTAKDDGRASSSQTVSLVK